MNSNIGNNWHSNNNHSGAPINSINNFLTTQPHTFPTTGSSSYAPYFSSGPITPDLNVSLSSSSRTNYPSTHTYSSLNQDTAPWTMSSGNSSQNQHSGGRPSINGWVNQHANSTTTAGTGNGASTTKGVSEKAPLIYACSSVFFSETTSPSLHFWCPFFSKFRIKRQI